MFDAVTKTSEEDQVLTNRIRITAKVLFQTPLPVWSIHYAEYQSTSYAPEMLEAAAALGDPVGDAGAYALTVPRWNSSAYAQDSVHPNSAGYQLLVDKALAPAVEKLVNPMLCR